MSWIYLTLAILFEVSGTTAMKFSKGFTKLLPSLLVFLFYVISTGFLNLAVKRLDISLIYAIWSGVGTALITIIGILWFREPGTTLKLISIFLIIIGVIGLNLNK
ncbi:MAG: multidrug efflux SMR transporter [Anaerolineae bacterium]|nr:multidrug efflux SMR transporter [Anaerolineae bacterium]